MVYWAMMEGNEHLGNWFKDCFVNGQFDQNWERFRKPYNADASTLVFYPHGNLMLATSLLGGEHKIRREDDWDDLLYRITAKWQEGEIAPLFVSEGLSTQKQKAIRRSTYLSTVHDLILTEPCESVTFYGFSAALNDKHILRQLGTGEPQRVALSVYRGERPGEEIQDEIGRVRRRLKVYFPNAERILYWSESPGAWIH